MGDSRLALLVAVFFGAGFLAGRLLDGPAPAPKAETFRTLSPLRTNV